ncbi:UNC-like C-terminal-domain-containing protein [Cantharellus anzutake]|uniref:UNC-like C-terminal-domain-containing protein n=1 Tax=Cantharellus anzutake TaxID=1750568 RepID=UPI0019065943|nr:UNC-like C-terminal-domain-containing protein [Cantharellus anzutake]KAF8324884.1 UNC-like C-terminal-domain-containing protein [Cantharellus anzutake]
MGSSEKRAGTSAWMATLTVVCMLRYCIGSLTPNEHSPHRQNTCRMTVQDQFRPIITIHSPVCSVSDIPVAMTDDFPSFEEWKRLRFSQTPNKSTDDNMESSNAGGPEDAHINSHAGSSASPKTLEDIVPTLRVPLTDRFNYASVDCSARIHSSHKESKSPASILSPKRDKYMLSPCATPGKFVIVELCDDIQIDTIQLANSEFFSGVFKDISVSVSVEQKHWKHVGTYSAKNIRTVQSFHPPPDPHFYRYVRIDFLSHYGLEYYCPVSLLHVYGLTQMEEYKWNEWQAAGRKEREAGAEAEYLELAHSQTELIKLTSTAVGATSSVNIGPTESTPAERSTSGQDTVAEASNSAAASATSAVAADIQSTHTHTPIIVPTETLAAPEAEIDDIVNQIMTGGPVYAYAADGKSNASSNIPAESEISSTAPSAPDPAASALQSTATHASPSESSTLAPLNSTAVRYVRSPTDSSTLRSTRPSSYSPSPSLATGESVYRNIMKRLVALESNSSLSVKYIEDQAKSVREALKKLEDDVGKLQTSHQLALRKALLELRNQKRDMEVQRMEFVTQLHTLSNEITLEKRLGVAQLCLLLMVLVFMTFTRGASPGGSLFDELSVPKNSMRTGRRPNLFWRANGLRTNSEPEKPNSSCTSCFQCSCHLTT